MGRMNPLLAARSLMGGVVTATTGTYFWFLRRERDCWTTPNSIDEVRSIVNLARWAEQSEEGVVYYNSIELATFHESFKKIERTEPRERRPSLSSWLWAIIIVNLLVGDCSRCPCKISHVVWIWSTSHLPSGGKDGREVKDSTREVLSRVAVSIHLLKNS